MIADFGRKHVDVHYTDSTTIFRATTREGDASTLSFNKITVLLDADTTARFDRIRQQWFGKDVLMQDILARIVEAGLRELCDYPMYAEEA